MSKGNSPILSAYDLRRDYDTPAGELTILKAVHFSVAPGEMAFIVGRSGCGKTTLLHLLGGLDRPTSGKILFEGENLTLMRETQMAKIRNRRMGFVFQFYHLIAELTLYENVLLPGIIAGAPNEKWAEECLRKVRLHSRKDHYPSELSGGEKQRGAIARALVNRPSIVFCDEPTGNLDEDTASAVLALIDQLNREDGQTFVVVTHDEALAWRNRNVYRLVDGTLHRQDSGPVNVERLS